MADFELNIGQEYVVILYPQDNLVRAEYKGKREFPGASNQHLFALEDAYVTLDEDDIIQDEKDRITHNQFSSIPAGFISTKKLDEMLKSVDPLERADGQKYSRFLDAFQETI